MKILVVVDMQNDFIDGSLGTGEAQVIVPRVAEKIKSAVGEKEIIFTMDTHGADYLETQEGRILPVPHCVQGSAGWQIREQLTAPLAAAGVKPKTLAKGAFGSTELVPLLTGMHEKTPLEEIELVGLCTDICVISNALILKAFLPEVPIAVDASCCAGVTPQSHENALNAMQMCQIEIRGRD